MRPRYLQWVTIHMNGRVAPPNGADYTWAGPYFYSLEKYCPGKFVRRDALGNLPESLVDLQHIHKSASNT